MNLVKLKCENCGAQLEVNSELDKIKCNFCGSEILIDDAALELSRIEDAKLKSREKNHEQYLKERQDLLEQDLKEKEILDKANAKEKFKKSIFSKVLLVFFAIAILLFFAGYGFLVKSLTLIQAGLFIIAWLMGMEIIKEPIKGLKIILAIIAFVLVIPILNTGGGNKSKEYENINWDYIIMKDQLPKPNGTKGDINSNSDDYLSVDISVKSEDEYREYIEQCKKFGYVIDAKNNTSSYEAKNEIGYDLRISYSDHRKEYTITLNINKKTTNEAENNNNSTTPTTPANNNEMALNFKTAMDNYEEFMDKYIAFMKKYNNNPSDISLLNDYAKYLEEYSEMIDSFEKWEDKDLNDTEMQYYLEVQARVTKKLTDAALNY